MTKSLSVDKNKSASVSKSLRIMTVKIKMMMTEKRSQIFITTPKLIINVYYKDCPHDINRTEIAVWKWRGGQTISLFPKQSHSIMTETATHTKDRNKEIEMCSLRYHHGNFSQPASLCSDTFLHTLDRVRKSRLPK